MRPKRCLTSASPPGWHPTSPSASRLCSRIWWKCRLRSHQHLAHPRRALNLLMSTLKSTTWLAKSRLTVKWCQSSRRKSRNCDLVICIVSKRASKPRWTTSRLNNFTKLKFTICSNQISMFLLIRTLKLLHVESTAPIFWNPHPHNVFKNKLWPQWFLRAGNIWTLPNSEKSKFRHQVQVFNSNIKHRNFTI